jgi:CRISPR system Cascade subunit CasE
MAAFEPETRGETRVLFRREPEPRGGWSVLLVQSEVRPDWERAAERFRLEGMQSCVKEWDPVLRPGQQFRFRLRANPTVKRNGKRLGLFGKDEAGRDRQLEWLRTRMERGGCRVAGARVVDEGLLENREPRLEFQSALFEGGLCVEEPHRAEEIVRSGVGSAKGFGFGLLSLAAAG